jgi:voltage-gated potassium channel
MCIGTAGFRLIEGYSLFDAFGLSALFCAVGAMTQTIIELELQDRFGKRRKKWAIMQMKDHYIVCGFGCVGRNAAFELQRAGAQFLVVDRNEQRVERARGFIAALATDADT